MNENVIHINVNKLNNISAENNKIPLSDGQEMEKSWETVKNARKENRPQTRDYLNKLFRGVFEVKGDRCYGDDQSIVTAIAWFENWPVTIIGQQKGHTLEERMKCNFGMPNPEGYRKSIRALKQAEKFSRPVICLVDTPGAYPGVDAENRGQGLIIAEHLKVMATLRTPTISVIIGEGGSGGALALSLSDWLIMLDNSYFSVISPESGASILYKDSNMAEKMAKNLKLTANDLKKSKVIDSIIKEPEGFDRYNMDECVLEIRKELRVALSRLTRVSSDKLVQMRHDRYLEMRGL